MADIANQHWIVRRLATTLPILGDKGEFNVGTAQLLKDVAKV
jgi:hypothetical protein